jgi:hypothetical protein
MKKVLFVFAVAGLLTVVSCKNEGAKTDAVDSTKIETPKVDSTVVVDTTKKVEEVVAPVEVKKDAKKEAKKEVKKEEKKK